MTSTMTLSAVRTVVGRQWLSRSSTSSSVFASTSSGSSSRIQYHVSLLALGMITSTVTSSSSSTHTSTYVLCEDKDDDEKKGFMGRLFGGKKQEEKEETKKDSESNFPSIDIGDMDWSKALEKLQSNQFWDQVAATAGGKVQSTIDSGIPTQLSYGFVSGYCSGMALKKIGRVAAGVFGLGFMTLQALSYSGYVQVDHVKIQEHFRTALDLNDDGSVDGKDRAIATEKLMEVLQYNLPAGSGFTMGFVGGLRSG